VRFWNAKLIFLSFSNSLLIYSMKTMIEASEWGVCLWTLWFFSLFFRYSRIPFSRSMSWPLIPLRFDTKRGFETYGVFEMRKTFFFMLHYSNDELKTMTRAKCKWGGCMWTLWFFPLFSAIREFVSVGQWVDLSFLSNLSRNENSCPVRFVRENRLARNRWNINRRICQLM
jgi:hypothetical protein